jgi:hypothetical protein
MPHPRAKDISFSKFPMYQLCNMLYVIEKPAHAILLMRKEIVCADDVCEARK